MKFIPILVLLLCCGGVDQVAADGCFSKECHNGNNICDMRNVSSHDDMTISRCMSCHTESCAGVAAALAEKENIKVEKDAGKHNSGTSSSTGTTIEMYTEDQSEFAENAMIAAGIGYLFALIGFSFNTTLLIVPLILVVIAIAGLLFNQKGLVKWAILGLAAIIGLLMVLSLTYSTINSIKPDLSVITI